MGISNEPQKIPASEPIPFCFGPLRGKHPYLLSSFASIHLPGQEFLESIMPEYLPSETGNKIILK